MISFTSGAVVISGPTSPYPAAVHASWTLDRLIVAERESTLCGASRLSSEAVNDQFQPSSFQATRGRQLWGLEFRFRGQKGLVEFKEKSGLILVRTEFSDTSEVVLRAVLQGLSSMGDAYLLRCDPEGNVTSMEDILWEEASEPDMGYVDFWCSRMAWNAASPAVRRRRNRFGLMPSMSNELVIKLAAAGNRQK